MNFETLRNDWSAHNERLEKLLRLNEGLVRSIQTSAVRSRLRWVLAGVVAELVLAAETLADNAFMMGDNPGGVKYATVDYLIRDDGIVEKWLENADTAGNSDLTKLEF